MMSMGLFQRRRHQTWPVSRIDIVTTVGVWLRILTECTADTVKETLVQNDDHDESSLHQRDLADESGSSKPSVVAMIFGFLLVIVGALAFSVQGYFYCKNQIKKRKERRLAASQAPKRQMSPFFKPPSNGSGNNYDGDLSSSSSSSAAAVRSDSSSSSDLMAQELKIAAKRDTRVWQDYEEKKMKLIEEGRVVGGKLDEFQDEPEDDSMVFSDESSSRILLPNTDTEDSAVRSFSPPNISTKSSPAKSPGVDRFSPYGEEEKEPAKARPGTQLSPHRYPPPPAAAYEEKEDSLKAAARSPSKRVGMKIEFSPEQEAFAVERKKEDRIHHQSRDDDRQIIHRPLSSSERRVFPMPSMGSETTEPVSNESSRRALRTVPTRDSSVAESNDSEAILAAEIVREFRDDIIQELRASKKRDEVFYSDGDTSFENTTGDTSFEDNHDVGSDDGSAIELLKSLSPTLEEDENDVVAKSPLQNIVPKSQSSPSRNRSSLRDSSPLDRHLRGPLTPSDTKVMNEHRPAVAASLSRKEAESSPLAGHLRRPLTLNDTKVMKVDSPVVAAPLSRKEVKSSPRVGHAKGPPTRGDTREVISNRPVLDKSRVEKRPSGTSLRKEANSSTHVGHAKGRPTQGDAREVISNRPVPEKSRAGKRPSGTSSSPGLLPPGPSDEDETDVKHMKRAPPHFMPSDESSTNSSSDNSDVLPTEAILKEVEQLKSFVQKYEQRRERQQHRQEERRIKQSSPGVTSSLPSPHKPDGNDSAKARRGLRGTGEPSQKINCFLRRPDTLAGEETGDEIKLSHRHSWSTDSTTGDSSDTPAALNEHVETAIMQEQIESSLNRVQFSVPRANGNVRSRTLSKAWSEEEINRSRESDTKNVRFDEQANSLRHFSVDMDDNRLVFTPPKDESDSDEEDAAQRGRYDIEVVGTSDSSSESSWESVSAGSELLRLGISPFSVQRPPAPPKPQSLQPLNEGPKARSSNERAHSMVREDLKAQSSNVRARPMVREDLKAQSSKVRASKIPAPGSTKLQNSSPASVQGTPIPPNALSRSSETGSSTPQSHRVSKIPAPGTSRLKSMASPSPPQHAPFTPDRVTRASAAIPEKRTPGKLPVREIRFSPSKKSIHDTDSLKQNGVSSIGGSISEAPTDERRDTGPKEAGDVTPSLTTKKRLSGIPTPSPARRQKQNPKFNNIVNMFESKPKNSIYPPNESWQYSY